MNTINPEAALESTSFSHLSSLPVVRVNHETHQILKWSLSAASLFGYHKEQALDLSFQALFPEPSWEEVQACLDCMFALAPGVSLELPAKHVSGEALQVELLLLTHPTFEGESLAVFRNISQQRKAIINLTQSDILTDLPNRKAFLARLDRQLEQDTLLAVMLLNVDRFKIVNETLGHDSGDQLLKLIAARLRDQFPGAIHGRWGGDEFSMALSIDRLEDGIEAAERVIRMLCGTYTLESQELFSTVSVGMSLFPQDGTSASAPLQNADSAMRTAKNCRGGFRLYTPSMSSVPLEQLALETHLFSALDRREFVLYYQPQIDSEGRLSGAEALIRWQHPEWGLVSPAKFIPLAEETGLIVPMTEWVLRTACAQGRSWMEQGLPPIRVAVNLSGRFFVQPGMVDVIQEILEETGLPPCRLELELTESILMKNELATITALNRLHDLGVSLSIDDFGTGYSSLGYLKDFPIDTLKIDQSFVRDLLADPSDEAIVRTIILLAHNLNLKVIAEGVENADLLTVLRQYGCDEFQGHHFSPPLPVDEFTERWLRLFAQ